MNKAFYLSKTFWTNVIGGVVVYIFPSIGKVLGPENLATVFVIANIILRSVTKDKLTLLP